MLIFIQYTHFFFLFISFSIAEVGRQLARIADDINERYRQQFEQIANHLDMSSDNVYENFSQIIQRYVSLSLFCLFVNCNLHEKQKKYQI